MGQVCCGSQEEAKKSSAFSENGYLQDVPENHTQQHSSSPFNKQQTPDPALDDSNPHSSSHGQDAAPPGDPSSTDELSEKERTRRLKQYQLEAAEQTRRSHIVSAASQSMIPVGTSNSMQQRQGGIYTYYDPAYAAAAAQDILNSAARSGGLMFVDDGASREAWGVRVMGVLPRGVEGSSGKDLMDALGKGRWDDVKLGSRESGVAGCGGEDPEYFLDDLAEAFLESMVPTKTNLFGGCPSIVENLL